jgi:hypothetical protein
LLCEVSVQGGGLEVEAEQFIFNHQPIAKLACGSALNPCQASKPHPRHPLPRPKGLQRARVAPNFFRYEVLPSAPPSHVRPNLRNATASSSTSNQDHLTSTKAGSTDLPSLKHDSTKSPNTRQTTGSLKTNHNPDYSEFFRDSISTRKNMSWFSILPASISFIEMWVIRVFVSPSQVLTECF